MSTVATAASGLRRRADARRTLPLPVARGSVLFLLGLLGLLHWIALLDPRPAQRAWWAIFLAAGAAAALLAIGRVADLRRRRAAAAAVAVVALALTLLAAGAADELLKPSGWDVLLAGIGRGLGSLPSLHLPYRGVDAWTRFVLVAGAIALLVGAVLLAFWPRRAGLGFRHASLVALVTLYAVPAIALNFPREFVGGAVLALLVLAYLRLDRLPLGDAAGAGSLALGAALVALAAAPVLDRDRPLWDYETWASDTASAGTVSFSWDHDYGPLDWPRDGREMLRIKARRAAYWKAEQLDFFDGERWRGTPFGRGSRVGYEVPDDLPTVERFTQRVQVNVRNLRTRLFITAGVPSGPPQIGRARGLPTGMPGIYVSRRQLATGDTYTFSSYVPEPRTSVLAASPPAEDGWLDRYQELAVDALLPGSGRRERWGVTFPSFGTDGEPEAYERRGFGDDDITRAGDPLLRRSDLERAWELAQRLRAQSSTPWQYLQRVEDYLKRGFRYTETPPSAARTLDGFLFDAKAGYCQQFSGAMALLLRMGGVPARVATGFSPGSFDRDAKEWVIRDLDAHSWVEVWFGAYGWVTRDPTPAAAAGRGGGSVAAGITNRALAPTLGESPGAQPTSAPATDGGPPWALLGALGGFVLACGLAGAWWMRPGHAARAIAPLPEFERAIRRAGWSPPPPGTTLAALERRLRGSPAAQAYARALREQRYRSGEGPTTDQRRRLRTEFARGGPLARARAWWALPPRRD